MSPDPTICDARVRSQEDLRSVTEALLWNGTARADRFLLRGLLNFFVAMERLAGAASVRDLALVIIERVERSYALEGDPVFAGCTVGDRYRTALCLIRTGAVTPTVLSGLLASEEISA